MEEDKRRNGMLMVHGGWQSEERERKGGRREGKGEGWWRRTGRWRKREERWEAGSEGMLGREWKWMEKGYVKLWKVGARGGRGEEVEDEGG